MPPATKTQVAELRKRLKRIIPGVKFRFKTVGFSDLARDNDTFILIKGLGIGCPKETMRAGQLADAEIKYLGLPIIVSGE